jgi:hypothetical protein
MSCSADGGTSGNNVLNDSLVTREGLKICEEPKPEPVKLQSAILRLQSRKPSIWRSRGSNASVKETRRAAGSGLSPKLASQTPFQAISQRGEHPQITLGIRVCSLCKVGSLNAPFRCIEESR